MAGMFGVLALGAAASASAGDKSDYCDRGRYADCYDDYGKDRHYKTSAYKKNGASFSITISNDHRYRNSYDRRYGNKRYRDGRRVVYRNAFDTRYRARIVLIEEVVHRRKGPRLVCTVQARGPEARYVSKRRIHRIADRHCSPRARVRVFT